MAFLISDQTERRVGNHGGILQKNFWNAYKQEIEALEHPLYDNSDDLTMFEMILAYEFDSNPCVPCEVISAQLVSLCAEKTESNQVECVIWNYFSDERDNGNFHQKTYANGKAANFLLFHNYRMLFKKRFYEIPQLEPNEVLNYMIGREVRILISESPNHFQRMAWMIRAI